MHFLMPDKFSLAANFDLNDPEQESKIKELHKDLEKYMLRRMKAEVIKSLPTKTERILRVELSAVQANLYKNILTRVCLITMLWSEFDAFPRILRPSQREEQPTFPF
jgi:chromodomain-helicase-DNA-binding protein 1